MAIDFESILWLLAFAVIVALAIPWFLWGVSVRIAGLPVWLWWHIGWMGLAAGLFWAFSRRGWGLGIPTRRGDRP